jgi:hypothetical protein
MIIGCDIGFFDRASSGRPERHVFVEPKIAVNRFYKPPYMEAIPNVILVL